MLCLVLYLFFEFFFDGIYDLMKMIFGLVMFDVVGMILLCDDVWCFVYLNIGGVILFVWYF